MSTYNIFDELYERLGAEERETRPATLLLDGLRNLSGDELEFVFDAEPSREEPALLERAVGEGLLAA